MPTRKIFIDAETRELYSGFADVSAGQLSPFYAGDSGDILEVHYVRLLAGFDTDQPLEYVSPGSASIQAALGLIDEPATGGTFDLIDQETEATNGSLVSGARYLISDYNTGDNFSNVAGTNSTGSIFTASGTTPTTWANGSTLVQIADALAFDISAANLQTALRAKLPSNYSVCTVTGAGPWLIDRVMVGEIDPLQGRGAALTPESFIAREVLRDGSESDTASPFQRVRTIIRPAAYATSSDLMPTYSASELLIVKRTGSASRNEIQRLQLPADCYGGTWQLTATTLGETQDEEISTDDISFGLTASAVQTLINNAFGEGNEVTVRMVDPYTLDITFSGEFVKRFNHAIMTADFTGLKVPQGWIIPFSLKTSGVVTLLGSEDSATVVFELQITDGDDTTTIYQDTSALLINDLIDPETVGATEYPGFVSTTTFDEFLARFTNLNTDATVSTAGNTAIPSGAFRRGVRIIASAGGGAYTRILVIETPSAMSGDTMSVTLEIAASANPTIELRNATAGGTLLQTVTGDAGAATYVCITLFYTGSIWRVEDVNYF